MENLAHQGDELLVFYDDDYKQNTQFNHWQDANLHINPQQLHFLIHQQSRISANNCYNIILGDDHDYYIKDLSPLAQLTQLTHLNLRHNKISDLSPIANLSQLTHLNLTNNKISDISPIANLNLLTTLGLTKTNISDLSPIANPTQLTALYLGWNKISDLSPIANLTQLTLLNLTKNNISDDDIRWLQQQLPNTVIEY